MPTSTQLASKLDAFPRLPLAVYPTPLEYLPRLSAAMGREIYVKRDDQIGPGLGGNKTRKLEFLMAEALERRTQKVVTFGGLQSNHARLTAAVACKLGLQSHLFYFDRKPDRMPGNLALNQLLGAGMHFIPLGGSGAGMTIETTSRLVHWLAFMRLGPHYFIPVGGHNWRGCLGYVRAAIEIDEQAKALGIQNAWLVVAAGSGGTLAGLLAGAALIGSPLKLQGIDVGKLWKGFPHSIARLAGEICTRLDEPRRFDPADVPLIENTYVGACYGQPSAQCISAMHRLAILEGLLLDPVYTAKAFTGLLDLVEKRQLGVDEPIIFLHTGGLPALFAFEYDRLC